MIMTKRTIPMGAALFALALIIGGVALTASSASAYTLACQGHDVGLSGSGLALGSDSALWWVQVTGTKTNPKLVSGASVTMYTDDPGASGSPALTCYYYLDSSSYATTLWGVTEQTLVWDPFGGNDGGCSGKFTDDVYVINNGSTGQMIDDNLDDDNVAGAGSCSQM